MARPHYRQTPYARHKGSPDEVSKFFHRVSQLDYKCPQRHNSNSL